MALTLGGANSDRINCGTGSSHDALSVGTAAFWCRPTSLGVTYDCRIFQKSLFANGNYRGFLFTRATSQINMEIQRSGVDLDVAAVVTNFTAWSLSTWMVLACTWDLSAASSNQRIYVGNQTTAPAEPSAYAGQVVGDSALADDSAADWIIGNNQNNNVAFLGDIAVQAVWSRQLSAGDLAAWAANPTDVGANLVMLHSVGSNGTDTQFDYSGNANHGTVTGTTVASSKPPVGLWTPVISPLYSTEQRRLRRLPLIRR